MIPWINVEDVSLNFTVTSYDELGQPEWLFHLLTAYHIFVLIACLGGNGLVLIASAKYNAVELDKVSLSLLQNLAVTDLLIGVLRGIPTLVSGIARRWVFGRSMCWFFGLFYWLPQKVEFLTIATVSIHRLFNLLFPLSTRGLKSARATRLLCCGIWLAVVGAIILDIFFKIPIRFDRTSSTCGIYYEVEQSNQFALQVLWFVTCLVLFLMPIGVTLVVNIAILGVAGAYRMRHTGSRIPSKSAFVTVTLVAWGFICSTFPILAVYLFLAVYSSHEIPRLALIIAWECLTINVWINPFIYTLINNRFRKFLLNLLSETIDKPQSRLRK